MKVSVVEGILKSFHYLKVFILKFNIILTFANEN